jgi:hypothetical protein
MMRIRPDRSAAMQQEAYERLTDIAYPHDRPLDEMLALALAAVLMPDPMSGRPEAVLH